MGLLAGVGVGGTAGAIIGALAGMGMPEYEAKRYDGRMKQGGILLSVHCDSPEWVKRAKDRLKETGAESIGSASESSSDFAKTDRPVRRHAEHLVIVPIAPRHPKKPARIWQRQTRSQNELLGPDCHLLFRGGAPASGRPLSHDYIH
jgi:hypothetical protein